MPAESQLIQKQVSGHIYNFVRSPNVKIFPCAYRGYYTQDAGGNITTKVFDPEARGYTEYNYTNMYSKVQRNKQSYVIDWKVTTGDDGTGPSLLKCVIGGYYFEIKGLLLSDFQGANAPKRLAIRTREVTLSNEPDDCERKSKILSGFIETTNYLDIRHSEGVYIFVGLAVLDQNEDVSYSDDLVPFKYASSTDNSLVLDWSQYRIGESLSTGAGAYSVRNNGDFIEGAGETYAGSAAGDYAFAFGRQAQANGDSSVAFGNKTKTTGANTVAFGEETVAEAEGSVAFGRGTYASKSYGLVIGKYNEIPSDELNTRLFAIGNGGSNDSRRTVFYVTEAGDTVVKGGITVSGGDIILNHDGPNLLQLGSTADGCSGELKIHGSGADTLVCYINEEGTMLLKGDIGAEGNMAILGTGSIGESLLVKNTLAIENKRLNDESRPVTLAVDGDVVIARGGTNKLTIGSSASNDVGALDIWGVSSSAPVFQVESSGNITTKGTLTVAQKTTLSNQLEVSGATTLKNTLRTEGAASFINTVGIEKLLTLGAGATITTGAVSASSSDFTIKSLTIKNGSTTTASIATEGDLVASNTLKVKVGTAEKFSVNASGDTTMAGNLTVSGGKLNLSNAKIEIIKKGNLYYYEMDKNIKLGGAYHAQGSIYLYRPDGDTGFSNLETSKAMVKIINSSGDITTKGSLDVGGTLKTTGMATMGAINASGTVTTTGSSNTFEGNVTIGKSNAAKALQVYGTITASDTIQGKSFDATSDVRLKQNIVDYHCEKSILDLPIKEFEFIDDEKHIKHIGCLAQDLQQICPEIVHENVDGYLHIEETKLVYLLLQEVKALKEEIKALKGE